MRPAKPPASRWTGAAALGLALAFLAAGCAQAPERRLYQDPGQLREATCEPVGNVTASGEAAVLTPAGSDKPVQLTMDVPSGLPALDVAASWSVRDGSAALELVHPSGEVDRVPASPFVARLVDPPPGAYTLRLAPDPVAAGLAYGFRLAGAAAGC